VHPSGWGSGHIGGERGELLVTRQPRALRGSCCKAMFFLLSQNPGADPKVVEGYLVGN